LSQGMLREQLMFELLAAFSLFHLAAGTASLGLAVRLLTPEERAHWRSKRALFVAELLCWIYPALAFAGAAAAWRAFSAGGHHAFPLMLAPFAWLLIMGAVFAIVDFAEDGVLGNTRER
jgi:hypothetical protein